MLLLTTSYVVAPLEVPVGNAVAPGSNPYTVTTSVVGIATLSGRKHVTEQ